MAERYLRRCRSVVLECSRLMSTDHVDEDTVQFVRNRLEAVRRAVQRSVGNLLNAEIVETLVEGIDETLEGIQVNREDHAGGTSYTAPRVPVQGNRGASKFYISRDQLQFLNECHFTTAQMAEIFGVSQRTVYRRLKEFDITRMASYSDMSDMELDEVISGTVRGNSRLGPNAVTARLRGIDIKVQRQRVRDSMIRIDPEGAAERAMRPQLHRRRYRVAGPNSLWHIDGNHKLIRWRIVIHGGIDGFSRLLVFLNASNNNRAETVLNAFTDAVASYGLPSRVRCDFGGENNDVCSVMEIVRGGGRGSALRGTSTHNQRIERSWVDMWCGVTNLYYDLFAFLEAEGHLNVDDAVQIWALHYIYIPRINQDLKLFIGQWNNHGLRTEGSRTPLQLFVGHVLRLQWSNHTAIQDMFGAPLQPAEVPPPEGMEFADLVEVPATASPLSRQQYEQLLQLVDPLDVNDPLGISLYTRTVAFVESL